MRVVARRLEVWALAAAVGLAAFGAGCGGGGGGGNGDTVSIVTTTTATAPHTTVQSVSAAVPIVQRLLTIHLSDNDARVLIVDLCAAATTGNHGTITTDLTALSLSSDADLKATITALGRGAEAYCPDGVAIAPNLLNDLDAAVAPGLRVAATTPTTTAAR